MRTHVRLYVLDGKVLCPRGCEWKDVERCAECAELERLEPGKSVTCTPEIDDLTTTITRMAHG